MLVALLGEPTDTPAAEPRAGTSPGGLTRAIDGLAHHQRDALTRLRCIMRRRGGALLADSVGLGKTHVAAALVAEARAADRAVVVAAPAALEAHWKRHLRGVRGWRWLSHASLSRGGCGLTGAQLVIADEAHAFRNPATRRYVTLARLCAGARVLLVTATPVNNSVLDLYHLLRLFARDDAFSDVGVPDLAAAFGRVGGSADLEAVRRAARAVMVRRTRDVLRRRYGTSGDAGSGPGAPRFPDREPPRHVRYDLSRRYGSLPVLLDDLQRLRFPAHCAAGGAVPAELMRLGLLKRLESSVPAFRASLLRQRAVGRSFIDAAERGLLLDAAARTAAMVPVAGGAQLSLDAVLLRDWPAEIDRARCIRQAMADLQRIDRMLRLLEAPDPKLDALRELVTGELAAEKVLVFSEYRDTAVAIWERLVGTGGVALVHGNEARLGADRAARRTVIDRFAPLSNRARAFPPRERVRVLVATDVLAEGLNLQDARVVISYDVPWNPVRLAQRVGRIDRLGSPHATVAQFVFVPDRGVDEWLGLVRAVRAKLRTIRAVGGDTHHMRSATSAGLAAAATDPADPVDAAERAWRVLLERPPAPHPPGEPPLFARTAVAGAGGAALVCLRDGPGAALVLIRPDDSTSVGCDEGLRLLVAVLEHAAGRPCGDAAHAAGADARFRRLHRLAVRALTGLPADAAPGRPGLAAARLVHRWIAGRTGGATEAECDVADTILRFVTSALSADDEFRVARALRPDTQSDRIAELLALARGAEGRTRHGPRRPDVVGIIDIAGPGAGIPPPPSHGSATHATDLARDRPGPVDRPPGPD